jgi:serine/threonine protein kinase
MGTVLRGRDPRDGRDVAIKLLFAAQGAREEQRRRFAREAEALSRLRHPGIVGVLGAGEEQGAPFLVMEHVAGGTLEERLARQGPLRPGEAADVVRAVAEALAHAHAQGVVHRDLKPSNVLLGPTGPRLVDFGLVRDLDPARSRLTRTGVVLGTPGFLAPEQVGAE